MIKTRKAVVFRVLVIWCEKDMPPKVFDFWGHIDLAWSLKNLQISDHWMAIYCNQMRKPLRFLLYTSREISVQLPVSIKTIRVIVLSPVCAGGVKS